MRQAPNVQPNKSICGGGVSCLSLSQFYRQRGYFPGCCHRAVAGVGECNCDAVFEPNAEWGNLHYDEHNALDFPMGTYRHVRGWLSEKTGVSERTIDGLAAIVVIGIVAYFGRKR